MLAYVIRRILFSIVVLIFSSMAIFMLVRLSGDPLAQLRQNPRITGDDIERISKIYGLDQPLPQQYLLWVGGMLQGDLGTSFKQNAPVNDIIGRRVGPTVLLIGTSLVVTVLIAVPLGIFQAIKKYSFLDNLFTFGAFAGFSTPVFVLALFLQLLLGVYLTRWAGTRIFYTSGMSTTGGFVDLLQHLVLPVMSIAVISIAQYSRFQRSAMLNVLSTDYLRTARAKGLSRAKVYFKHALRNAIIPIVTLVALSMGTVLAGAIVTESVFAWPGLGFLLIDSLYKADYNVARSLIMLIAVVVVIFNLIADLLYAAVDPRIRYN